MNRRVFVPVVPIALAWGLFSPLRAHAAEVPEGFVSLFNGKDLTGWKIPEGDNGHWKVADGVIDYDALSEAKGDKSLWSEKEFGDFVLKVDWRFPKTLGDLRMFLIQPDGTYKKDENGKDIVIYRPAADSGIYLRGSKKAQLNIWCWPCGSGEVWGYRVDAKTPPETRAACTPKLCADNPVGEWNTFEVTMKGDRLNVLLNGKKVIVDAPLPGIPPNGPIALQHHGGMGADGKLKPNSSVVQFRNIFLKELGEQE
ncbi:MAG: DUF1080 domain-containing protein [Candidatus Sumerlaeota bacterium]|nr:DUF1080 domain-containing protein [Candidatus Sumerlaeota bacterium]